MSPRYRVVQPGRHPSRPGSPASPTKIRAALINAADQLAQRPARHVHPFRHHSQRFALNQSVLERIQIVAGWANTHCPQLAVLLHDQAVLSHPDHRKFADDRPQGQIVGSSQRPSNSVRPVKRSHAAQIGHGGENNMGGQGSC